MPTKQEVDFAAQLVHRGWIGRAAMEGCLRALAEGAGTLSLEDTILRQGLLSREGLERVKLEIAVSRGEVPDLVPGYRIAGRIGEGGMSWVLRAFRERTRAWVALKILRPRCAGDPRLRSRFLHEAKLLKGLRHENLVEGYEVGRVRGLYLFSMEFVEGESLLSYLDQNRAFNEDAALYVILQIARALEYLRGHGIVHRDIKPGNILLTRENTVKLCDLGLAGRARRGERGERGEGESTVGTVEYLSPEQARGRRDLDVRSDIYSLGVTLYHLVLGRLPFEGSNDREVLAKQILASLATGDLKQRVSPHMHYFIEKMMAKDRELRYQDPVELIRDIEGQIAGRKTLRYNPRAGQGAAGLDKPFEESPSPVLPGGLRSRRRSEIRERLRIKRIKRRRGR